jgi:glycosyltransferase involved in cell wall biosynthesis
VGHIALVGPSWPYRGGISRTTTLLADALERRGSLAAFLVAARQYPRWLYPGTRDIDREACQRLPIAFPCFGVLQPLSWSSLLRRLRTARPAAIVLPYWTWAWAGLDLALAHAGVAPLVGIVHNPADHDGSWLARRVSRSVLGRFRGFFCHARSVEAVLRERFPATPVAMHPLPPAAPTGEDRGEARRRLGLAPSAVAALCFGLIRPYKGVDVLLEAVASLPRETPLTLLLAGEPWGKLQQEVRRRLADERLSGRVVARLEWIPENEVATWFAAADCMVLPYRSATGSAVAAQAIGRGLPIVATRVGGLMDVVEEGNNGLLAAPGDPRSLAAALLAITTPETRRRLTRGAHGAASRWSWDSYARTLEDLVTAVLGQRPNGAAPQR